MAIFVPLLGFAGTSVLLNYHASQQLENVGREVRFGRMFWPPFGLGLFLGVWVGVTLGPRILSSIEFFDSWLRWFWGVPQRPQLDQKPNPTHS